MVYAALEWNRCGKNDERRKADKVPNEVPRMFLWQVFRDFQTHGQVEFLIHLEGFGEIHCAKTIFGNNKPRSVDVVSIQPEDLLDAVFTKR